MNTNYESFRIGDPKLVQIYIDCEEWWDGRRDFWHTVGYVNIIVECIDRLGRMS